MTGGCVRLGIDLDGVVADFNGGWIAAYNAQFGGALTTDLVVSWDSPLDLTHFEDMRAFWRWARNHGGHSVFRHLEPYDGAVDTLRALNREGHDIVIVTAKPDWAVHDTLEWLADHRIPTREIHVIEDKWEVDCDVYLDDSPHMVPDLVKHRADRVVCRFVRPWNERVDGALDVTDWAGFAELVHDLTANSGGAY
jgi:5'(3')-deoxyribonucleotidase